MTLLCLETKVTEALWAIADNRVEVENAHTSKCYSSSRGKYYTTEYRPDSGEIYANDNMSYYTDGFIGYPAIAHLLITGVVSYDSSHNSYLAGIQWKDLNQKNKNDYEKTCREIFSDIALSGGPSEEIQREIAEITKKINSLALQCILPKRKPPEGY